MTMSICTPEEMAKKVQNVAEEFHCSSAVFAVEKILKDSDNTEVDIIKKDLQMKILNSLNKNDYSGIEHLRTRIQELELEKRKSRETVRISFGKIGTAREVRIKNEEVADDGRLIYVVLSSEDQDALVSSAQKNEWNSETKGLKEHLRRLTAHELAHILSDRFQCGFGESEADAFADTLLNIRQERSSKIYT